MRSWPISPRQSERWKNFDNFLSCWSQQFWNNQPQDFLLSRIRNLPVIKKENNFICSRDHFTQINASSLSTQLKYIRTLRFAFWVLGLPLLHNYFPESGKEHAGWWADRSVWSQQQLPALFPLQLTLFINAFPLHADSPDKFTCFFFAVFGAKIKLFFHFI